MSSYITFYDWMDTTIQQIIQQIVTKIDDPSLWTIYSIKFNEIACI